MSSWILAKFLTAEPQWELYKKLILNIPGGARHKECAGFSDLEAACRARFGLQETCPAPGGALASLTPSLGGRPGLGGREGAGGTPGTGRSSSAPAETRRGAGISLLCAPCPQLSHRAHHPNLPAGADALVRGSAWSPPTPYWILQPPANSSTHHYSRPPLLCPGPHSGPLLSLHFILHWFRDPNQNTNSRGPVNEYSTSEIIRVTSRCFCNPLTTKSHLLTPPFLRQGQGVTLLTCHHCSPHGCVQLLF